MSAQGQKTLDLELKLKLQFKRVGSQDYQAETQARGSSEVDQSAG